MRDLRFTLDREMRRGHRLPAHVRRREARRLAAAIEAAGYGIPGPLVPGDPVASRVALQGAQVAVALLQAGRQIGAGVDRLVRHVQERQAASRAKDLVGRRT
ncbi:hypothetical protein [Methylobacterium iners]|uniref:Uncharacterized protein n=1 Tax=Methylobacterium iners TaxID=418707 RepID=A0ABQ4S4N3_9HYPH|nr:hypothetical protein [Methylobacterium iners]GJD97444.1 hypothetical protein OCOJLMKI_4675 [Methylobacterium iners]